LEFVGSKYCLLRGILEAIKAVSLCFALEGASQSALISRSRLQRAYEINAEP